MNSHLLQATAQSRVDDFCRSASQVRPVQSDAQLRRARQRRSSSDRARLGLRSLLGGVRVIAPR